MSYAFITVIHIGYFFSFGVSLQQFCILFFVFLLILHYYFFPFCVFFSSWHDELTCALLLGFTFLSSLLPSSFIDRSIFLYFVSLCAPHHLHPSCCRGRKRQVGWAEFGKLKLANNYFPNLFSWCTVEEMNGK